MRQQQVIIIVNYACILGGNLNDFHASVIATGLTVMKGVIYAFNCLIRGVVNSQNIYS